MNKIMLNVTVLTAFVLAISSWSPLTYAQSQRSVRKEKQEKEPSRGLPVKESAKVPPISVVNNPVAQYLSGEISVTVRGNENPIIRLGLAQNGVTLVEFPASDRFFAINPGNPDLVTVEDSPTKETDRFFVIRPGAGFAPAPEGSKTMAPATSIIVQMSSGMVVTFLLYPVRDIEQNAHRCVVTYDRNAIVGARRAAGLATDLDPSEVASSSRQRITSIRMTSETESSPSQRKSVDKQSPARSESPVKNSLPEQKEDPRRPKSENGSRSENVTALQNFRSEDVFPKGKENFGDSIHGLKIAARTQAVFVRQNHVAEAVRIAVAVRNTLDVPIKIVPGNPELQVQTLDKKGRVLQVEPIQALEVESSAPNGVIAPKQTAYYLIIYQAPIIGAKQRLRVAVAQINAADEPVMAELTTRMR
jgi:hypothetical protein